jgi:phosphomannomutase/phosphoglucomutase
LIERDDFEKGEARASGTNIIPAYHELLRDRIRLGDKRKPKVVLDSGNGAAGPVALPLVQSLGCDVIPLYCESDPSYPNHHPDPTKLDNIRDMVETVREQKADVGIGFDGDCDRIGTVDENGDVVWADQLMILFAREVLQHHPHSPIILDVKCSQALVEEIERAGGKPIMWKTGHSLIKAKLWEENAPLAGEMSGHIFFKDDYFGYDDALYAACRLIRLLSNSEKTVSQMLADAPKYHSTPELRPYCPDERKFDVVRAVVEDLKSRFDRVIDVDGVRVVTDDGWGLVRASNTQPALIVRCEGKTTEALERMKEIIGNALSKHPEVKLDWEHQGE